MARKKGKEGKDSREEETFFALMAGEGLLNMQIARAEFNALLDKYALPEKIADLYLKKWREKIKRAPWISQERAAPIMADMQPTADELRTLVGERMYFAAGLLAHILTVSRNKPVRKAHVRSLVELLFFRANPTPLRDGRGAKRRVTDDRIRKVLREHGKVSAEKAAELLDYSTRAVNEWGKNTKEGSWAKARDAILAGLK